MHRKYARHALLAAGAIILAAGCAQKNGDINRVQPNVVRKADLVDGVWYYRNTVSYSPATSGFTYTGLTGDMEKIVFEVNEKSLVGYRAYQLMPGTDPRVDDSTKPSGTTTKVCQPDGSCVGGHEYYGAPVIAYPITSHFDIQRSYNAATGEPGNVITENASDRPWNEREYVRVDWSAQLMNGNFSYLGFSPVINPSGNANNSVWVQANQPGTDVYDWPTFEFDENQKLKYFDFTGQYTVAPDMVYIEGYGYYPRCRLMIGYRADCTAQDIRLRTSIARVDPKRTLDYEPLWYPNDVFAKFGYFRTERLTYDRRFGFSDTGVIYLANRHRIWESAFQKDDQGWPDPTQPIAFADRKLKPIVYYLTPAERAGGAKTYQLYREAAADLEKNWDKAFRRAVAAAQGGAAKDPNSVPQMLYVCENPVPAGAPAACGPVGSKPKFGDLRYSFLNNVPEPALNGLLGYGPSSADPETGEIISANANTYSAAVDSVSQSLLDQVDVMVGDKSIDELVSGADVKAYINSNPNYASILARKQNALQSELTGIVQKSEPTQGAFDRPTPRLAAVLDSLRVKGGPVPMHSDPVKRASDRLEQYPELESLVLDNPDFQKDLLALIPPELVGQALDDKDFLRKAARKALTHIQDGRAMERERQQWFATHNMFMAEFVDRAELGLAMKIASQRRDRVAALMAQGAPGCANASACTATEARAIADDEIRDVFRKNVWRATSEHEIGHTFGLRHNFQGSYDSVNYPDEYWRIRQPTLGVIQGGQLKVPRTPGDLKAAIDGTELEIARGMFDQEYASIMDYGGKYPGEWLGPGKYDEAAILFAYSGGTAPGYVEVFNGARKDERSFPGSDGLMLKVSGAGYDLPIVNAQRTNPSVPGYTERFHFFTVPLHFGEGSDLETTIADGIQKLSQRTIMKWSDVKKERDRVAMLLKVTETPTPAQVGNPPLEVPYQFCTDENEGATLACKMFDFGPDYYSIARTKIDDYWNYYFWTHFKRDRYYFSSQGAFNGAINTFMDLSDIYKRWVFAMYGYTTPEQQNLPRYAYDPLMQDTWSMAVFDAANAHLNVMTVPTAGLFMHRDPGTGPEWEVLSEGEDFDNLTETGQKVISDYYNTYYNASAFGVLKRGVGRRMYSRYDFKSGWLFQYRMLEAGHYNDQAGAMIAAVLPQMEYAGADITADQHRYLIPYYQVFKDEFGSYFGSLWSMNEKVLRPLMYLDVTTITNNGSYMKGQPRLAMTTPIRGEALIKDFVFPRKPLEKCVGAPTDDCIPAKQAPAGANIQLTWTARIYALWLGMSLFNINYDLDYAKQNQVFKLGSGEQVTLAPGTHAVEVIDINTGARFVTPEKDGAPPNSTPAVRLTNIANAYLTMVQDPTTCPIPPMILQIRSAPYGGTSCMPDAEKSNPVLVEQRRKAFFEYYKDALRDLDITRGFYEAFGRAL